MEKCPKCRKISLVFDPYTKTAKCLRLECTYREPIDYVRYSNKYTSVDKLPEKQLTLSLGHTGLIGNT